MHNNNTLISIIVPVYKVEQYLSRCVDSILMQTFTDFECILVDDGSPDNCPQICDEYAKKDARIKVIHKANGGLSDARNCGTDASVGEYITFIDSDDFIAPNYIEYLYDLLQKHNADISACGRVRVDDDEAIYAADERIPQEQVLTGKETCVKLLGDLHIPLVTAWGKLYKAEIVKKHPFPYGKKHEDDATTCKFYYSADTVVLGNQQLYAYFINQFGIMHTINPKEVNVDAIWALNHQAEFFLEKNEFVLAQMSWDYLFYYMVKDSKNSQKRCDRYIKGFSSIKHLSSRRKFETKLYLFSDWLYYRYANSRKFLKTMLLKLRRK